MWLREEYDRQWQARYGRPRSWDKYEPHFDSIVRQATEQFEDHIAAMAAAVEAFLADPDQEEYGNHSPQSLAKLFHRYVASYREQTEASEQKRKAAAAERRHQEAKRRGEAEHMQKVRERARRGEQNGQGPMADAVTGVMRSIDGGKV